EARRRVLQHERDRQRRVPRGRRDRGAPAGAPMRIVAAGAGASGAISAVRFLKACLELGVTTELVVSDYGNRLLIEELGLNLKAETVESWLARTERRAPPKGSNTR